MCTLVSIDSKLKLKTVVKIKRSAKLVVIVLVYTQKYQNPLIPIPGLEC